MKYCINCGQKLKPGLDACPGCGTSLVKRQPDNQTTAINNNVDNEIESETRSSSKGRRSQKAMFKWIGIIAAFLVLGGVLAGIYLSEKKKSDPTAAVAEFKQAVLKQDFDKVMDIMKNSQTGIKADKEMAKAYVKYLNNHQKMMNASLSDLEKKAENADVTFVKDSQGNAWFALKETGKKWGMFNQYKVVLKPFFIEVNSNFADTVISLNGKEQGKVSEEDSVEIGPVLPGEHNIEAKYEGQYSTLSDEKRLDFSKAEDNRLKVGIPLKGNYVTIYTDPTAKIYINGTESGIDPGKAYDIGPFAADGSVTFYAEMETGDETLKSEEVKLINDKNIYLNFDYAKAASLKSDETASASAAEGDGADASETEGNPSDYSDPAENTDQSIDEEALGEFMHEFTTSSVEAINNNDFSYVSSYLDQNGPGYEETRKYIDHLNAKGISEELQSANMKEFSLNSKKEIEVSTTEEYKIIYEDGSEVYKTFNSRYLVLNDNGGFLVKKLISTEEV